MKSALIASTLLLVSFCRATEVKDGKKTESVSFEHDSEKFKIIAIDSTERLYTLVAARRDSVFTIISPIEIAAPCQRIRVKEKYNLLIHSVFPRKAFGSMNLSPGGVDHVADFIFYGKIFHLERGEDLYRANNLTGLCLH